MTERIGAIGAKLVFIAAVLFAVFQVAGTAARTPRGPATPSHAAVHHPVRVSAAGIQAAPRADQRFVVRRILDIPAPLEHGDWYWDEKGAPAGPIVITVDLAAQVLSVFRHGYEIGTAVILYGADEKPTPLGTFAITQKDAHHISNIYLVPMPYMLRLTDGGVSIHGSKVEWNKGTSGCIGVPVPFAKLLFGQAKLGDRVIITNGKMLRLGEPIIRS